MIGTVLPIVYGDRERGRLGIAHWLHAVGSVSGGVAVGAAFGSLGVAVALLIDVSAATMLLIVGAVAAAYSLRELGLFDVPMPQVHRQVPASWRRRYPANVVAFLYGVGLGAGVGTFVRVATLYVIIVWIILAASPAEGAILMGAFGAARGLPIVWLGHELTSVEQGFAVSRLLDNWEVVTHFINGVLLSWAAAYFVVLSLRGVT